MNLIQALGGRLLGGGKREGAVSTAFRADLARAAIQAVISGEMAWEGENPGPRG